MSRREQPRTWDIPRCHRLLRPLTARLQSLRTTVQTQPSATATIAPPQKETKPTDPADQLYHPAVGGNKPAKRRRPVGDRAVFGELFGRRAVGRTYSSAPSRTATRPTPPTTSTNSQEAVFPAAALDWVAPVQAEAPAARPKAAPKINDNDPKALLNSLQPFVHESIFPVYVGIYTALESLITATQPTNTTKSPAKLQDLAIRKVAYCILATSKDEDGDDDAWYEAVEGTGVGGDNLRVLVRWHGLELVREAIVSRMLPSQKNGIGLSGVLIGLCKHYGADAEAESLLQTLMEQHPLSACQTDPSLVSLLAFWQDSPETKYRLLTQNLVSEGTPVALGNPLINQLLKVAVEQIETDNASAALVTRALDSAFGIWGQSYNSTAHQRRKDAARRKGSRKSANRDEVAPPKLRKPPPLPNRVGSRAEETALQLLTKLFSNSFKPSNTQTAELLTHLAHGFILQDEPTREFTEEAWEEYYPVAAKVLVLTYCLGTGSTHESSFVTEIVRCMEDIRSATGHEGLKRVGEFLAGCFEHRYSSTGKPLSSRDDMKVFINRLLKIAITPPPQTPNSTHSPPRTPKSFQTPLPSKTKIVTFTPGKPEPSTQRQKERYYITQLAINTITGFSALDCSLNNDNWISWASNIEHKIIGLKIRTPPKAKKPSATSLATTTPTNPPERKGWRYEEGLGEWVSVGGTPGIGLFKNQKPKPPVFKKKRMGIAVEVPNHPRKQSWRSEYADFTRAGSSTSPQPSSSSSSEEEAEEEEETPDTSFSHVFSDSSDPSGESDFYAPTPAKPPTSIRRSPRSAARLRKRLARLPPITLGFSSPILSRTRKKIVYTTASDEDEDEHPLPKRRFLEVPDSQPSPSASSSHFSPSPSPPRQLHKRPSPPPQTHFRIRKPASFVEPPSSPPPPRGGITFKNSASPPQRTKRKSHPPSPEARKKRAGVLERVDRNVLKEEEESEDELSAGFRYKEKRRGLLCRRRSGV